MSRSTEASRRRAGGARRAYGLVEILVGSGLAVMITGPLLGLWIGAARAERSLGSQLETCGVATAIMRQVSRDVLGSGGLATVRCVGTTPSTALLVRGGRAIHYEVSSAGRLMRHLHDIDLDRDSTIETLAPVAARIGLSPTAGGAVRVEVRLGDSELLETALSPRAW